jgi:hypothetical protein
MMASAKLGSRTVTGAGMGSMNQILWRRSDALGLSHLSLFKAYRRNTTAESYYDPYLCR